MLDWKDNSNERTYYNTNWLETYAEALELNVWTSSLVTYTNQDPISKYWLPSSAAMRRSAYSM